jgi:hypothetical protein
MVKGGSIGQNIELKRKRKVHLAIIRSRQVNTKRTSSDKLKELSKENA